MEKLNNWLRQNGACRNSYRRMRHVLTYKQAWNKADFNEKYWVITCLSVADWQRYKTSMKEAGFKEIAGCNCFQCLTQVYGESFIKWLSQNVPEVTGLNAKRGKRA